MKITFSTLANIFLSFVLLAAIFLVGATTSISQYSTTDEPSLPEYNPWCDCDDDGDIDLFDAVRLLIAYGSKGDPIIKASIQYNSSWIDITDKQGQYFNITHNLNSTDIMVDIQGKMIIDGGMHQWHLGGTDYIHGWNKTYGGTSDDSAHSMIQTFDGGYAITGYTWSFGVNRDAWLVKTDAAGTILWNQTYGGTNHEVAYSMVQTCDGGYTMAGATDSFGAGGYDFWLVKTDAAGTILWNQTYGGTNQEHASSVVQTYDGGYMLGGVTHSFGAGGEDYWLIKTNSTGHAQWNQTYGGTGNDAATEVIKTSDGGYAIIGRTNSFGAGSNDFWFIKTDSSGNAEWNQTYGGPNNDWGKSLVQTYNGGYAVVGTTASFGLGEDFWLVKTNSTGHMQWNQTYGGANNEKATSVIQTSDGGYAIAGWTASYGAGSHDFWLVKTDLHGNVQWNQAYGGAGMEELNQVIQTSDGGYAIAGWTGSYGAGGYDFWLVKTDPYGNAQPCFKYGLAWTDSTTDTITLYRGTTDPYWNYVRVRIWEIKEFP